MTATLRPPVGAVSRADPRERLNDYADALRFYLSLPEAAIDRIIFVDNSGTDLSTFVRLAREAPHSKTVELQSFNGNQFPMDLGKAYGEFRLLDFGLTHSSVIELDDVVWKTTGRLQVTNLPALRQKAGVDWDVLCDLHNVPFVGSSSLDGRCHMDLRFLAFRPRAFHAIFRVKDWTPDEHFDATRAYRDVLSARDRFRVCPRFPVQPEIAGVSGRHLRRYESGSQRVKDRVRGALRTVAPWLWL